MSRRKNSYFNLCIENLNRPKTKSKTPSPENCQYLLYPNPKDDPKTLKETKAIFRLSDSDVLSISLSSNIYFPISLNRKLIPAFETYLKSHIPDMQKFLKTAYADESNFLKDDPIKQPETVSDPFVKDFYKIDSYKSMFDILRIYRRMVKSLKTGVSKESMMYYAKHFSRSDDVVRVSMYNESGEEFVLSFNKTGGCRNTYCSKEEFLKYHIESGRLANFILDVKQRLKEQEELRDA